MPQMMPIYWLLIFFLCLMIFMMFFIMMNTYFIIMVLKLKMDKNIKFKYKDFKFKWD